MSRVCQCVWVCESECVSLCQWLWMCLIIFLRVLYPPRVLYVMFNPFKLLRFFFPKSFFSRFFLLCLWRVAFVFFFVFCFFFSIFNLVLLLFLIFVFFSRVLTDQCEFLSCLVYFFLMKSTKQREGGTWEWIKMNVNKIYCR